MSKISFRELVAGTVLIGSLVVGGIITISGWHGIAVALAISLAFALSATSQSLRFPYDKQLSAFVILGFMIAASQAALKEIPDFLPLVALAAAFFAGLMTRQEGPGGLVEVVSKRPFLIPFIVVFHAVLMGLVLMFPGNW